MAQLQETPAELPKNYVLHLNKFSISSMLKIRTDMGKKINCGKICEL